MSITQSAVPAPPQDIDHGVPWHYGDPLREQRTLAAGQGAVDLSHFGVVTVTGPDRLSWLHSLTSQHLDALLPGASSLALILSPHGHVEHELHIVDDDYTTWLIVAPGTSTELVQYLDSMRFMLRVEVADVTPSFAVVWEPIQAIDPQFPTWLEPADFAGTGRVAAGTDRGGDASKYVGERPAPFPGREVIVPREDLINRLESHGVVSGTWAWNALRVAAAVPRIGFETDHRTLPHEVGWIGPAVHLNKGCYRGQEAVARVHNMGHPPRRLVLLHLDGSSESLPQHGDPVQLGEKVVGWIASAARHYELGPVATAVIKRSVPITAQLDVMCADGVMPAIQEVVVATS
jgi:folate-binding protein YgfZ